MSERNWQEWAEFLAAFVDYNHGSGISDRAWDSYQGNGPADERPSWLPAPAVASSADTTNGE